MSFASADLNILDEFVPHVARDRFRLSLTDTVHGYWPNTGAFGKRLAADIDRATIDDPHDPTGLLRVVESLELAHYADFRIAPKSLPPQGSLASALLEFAELAREISGTGEVDSEAIATQAASVDEALARRFADVVRAVTTATRVRERAISRVRAQRDELFETPQGLYLDAFRRPDATTPEFHNTLLGDVDVSAMVSAARDVVATIRETQLALGAGVAPVAATLTLDTGLGRVALRGNGADVYDPADWERTILLVDTGGDDIYRFGAGSNATAAQPIGVVVDLGGSDRYGYREVPIAADASPGNTRLPSDAAGRYTPRTNDSAGPYSMSKVSRQGAGRLGIGILLDLGTERDEYRSHRVSQGYGALGVGVLYDREGDDLYIAEAASQGAAVAGVGLLIDSFGNDSYTAYHASQGFGYTRGIGALFDHRGDDTYVAVATDFLYANAQDPRASNTSMSQGAGYGRRRDQLDTGDLESMSGGIGILRDSRGNDRYTAQIFAQGVGYWWGIGALLDGDGNDHYDGQWYVQGSAAHFATAIFIDDGGDDVHNMTARRMNAALGTGHDFSIGWFQSRGGADHYLAPNLSLGSGNAAGVGIFIDESGVDRYESTSDLSFGNADIETPATDTLQFQAGTHGLFFDLGGVDTYARPIGVPVGDNMSWRQQRHTGVNELGAGRDEEGRW